MGAKKKNTKTKKTGRGGRRSKAGRKTVDDKKEAITIYVRASKIKKLGGDMVRQICYDALSKHE